MKTIGLLGGMSWESTATYYRAINEGVKAALGGLHSAKILLHSVDFAEIETLQRAGAWDDAGRLLAEAAGRLEQAGAELLAICSNTMHKVADQVQARVTIPLLHIADATGRQATAGGLTTVGLLGTRFTMEESFYRSILEERYHLQVLTPPAAERGEIDRIIFTELCVGRIRESSRDIYRRAVDGLAAAGCQAVILGCTEIALLITARDAAVPLLDTTEIHCRQAVRKMLA